MSVGSSVCEMASPRKTLTLEPFDVFCLSDILSDTRYEIVGLVGTDFLLSHISLHQAGLAWPGLEWY